MSIAKGIENGLATADMSPWEFAPTAQQQLEWPKWGQYYRDQGPGRRAARPALGGAAAWRSTRPGSAPPIPTEHARIWHEMLRIWADEVFRSASIAGVPQPVVVSANLRNVPEEGMYNWDPGAHFGMYKPDTFWFDDTPAPAASARSTPRAGLRRGSMIRRDCNSAQAGLVTASGSDTAMVRLAPGLRCQRRESGSQGRRCVGGRIPLRRACRGEENRFRCSAISSIGS